MNASKEIDGLWLINTTFNIISWTSWQYILLVERILVPRENHYHFASYVKDKTLSYNIISNTKCTSRHKQESD